MRWLFYASDGYGLGHITRTLALARQIRLRAPGSEFLFLTNCEAANLLWQEGFASVKLPSQEAHKECGLGPMTLRWLNQALVVDTFAAFRPQITVVDSFPAGWTNELIPVLRFHPRKIFICREKIKRVRELPVLQQHIRAYDLVLMAHPRNEVEFPFPEGVPVVWPGHFLIRSRDEALSREEGRRRLGLPQDGFIVYVGFGGGGDPEYRDLSEWILEAAAQFPDWAFAFSAPLLLRGDVAEMKAANVVDFSYYPLAECWPAFDGAISAFGANTTAELLHNGVPAIYVPRQVTEDDHQARAARVIERGAGWVVAPFDTEALHDGLRELGDADKRIAASENARSMVPENGATRAAEHVLKWLKTSSEGG